MESALVLPSAWPWGLGWAKVAAGVALVSALAEE
jgi:hypothetical protein